MEGENYRASGLFASLDDLFVQRVPESAMRFVFSDVYNRQRREHVLSQKELAVQDNCQRSSHRVGPSPAAAGVRIICFKHSRVLYRRRSYRGDIAAD